MNLPAWMNEPVARFDMNVVEFVSVWLYALALAVAMAIEPWRRRDEIRLNASRGKLPRAAYEPVHMWVTPVILLLTPGYPLLRGAPSHPPTLTYDWLITFGITVPLLYIHWMNRRILLKVVE